jgi:hypothetical protein
MDKLLFLPSSPAGPGNITGGHRALFDFNYETNRRIFMLTALRVLGACPRIDRSTADKPGWPDFPIIFVK